MPAPTAKPPTPQAQAKEVGPNPFAQLGIQKETSRPERAGLAASESLGEKRKAPTEGRPRSRQGHRDQPELWEDRTLSSIFRLTLNPDQRQDAFGNKLHYVEGLRSELEESGQPKRLNTSVLDTALLEVASNLSGEKPLDYLLGCWKRVARALRGMRTGDDDVRYGIVKEARRLCMSYCIFAVTIPDMFNLEQEQVSPLAKHLLVDPENDRGICQDFLSEAVSRFDEDESIKDALVDAMDQLRVELSTMTMNDNYKPYILALRNVCRYPALLKALAESPKFIPADVPAQSIEKESFLGPFFQISPMQGEVALNYFSAPRTRDRSNIANSQRALRLTLQTHQDELFDIADRFVKNKETRGKILDWFALTVNANHKRRAIQVDPRHVSSDGFMVNVTAVLDRLCEPFMDATFSKIDRIDPEYLRRDPRVKIDDETKINADQTTSDNYFSQKADGTSNFISEVFFLTVASHHYGPEAAQTKLSSMQKDVKYMEKQLEKLETERHKYTSNPMQLRMFEAAVKKYKDQVEKTQCVILAIQGVLLDELAQGRSMLFMRYVIVWLLRLATQSSYPAVPLKLPLPEQQPDAFKCLPEYFLEDIVDNFKFITRTMPQIINTTQCEELVMICITFLRSSEYIKNPYLKSGLVTILFHGVWPVPNRPKGVLGDSLYGSNFAMEHLLHSLMKFYIEAESTGTHTQFFDKFNIRYEIFQVIRCIWPNSIYREHLSTEAK